MGARHAEMGWPAATTVVVGDRVAEPASGGQLISSVQGPGDAHS